MRTLPPSRRCVEDALVKSVLSFFLQAPQIHFETDPTMQLKMVLLYNHLHMYTSFVIFTEVFQIETLNLATC